MIDARSTHSGADLVLFPELSLGGYAQGEEAAAQALPLPVAARLARSGTDPSHPLPLLAFGFVERGGDHLVYNSAVVTDGDQALAHHRKVYLPTYGIFDEGRTFARSRRGVTAFDLGTTGWRTGLLVCEDLWHPALPYLLALQQIDLLIVPVAAPGRGEPTPLHPLYGSAARWDLIARSTALLHGIFVVIANRTGAEAGLTFAGGSMIVDPFGDVVARAPQGEEATLDLVLDRETIRLARGEFSHLRDEDPDVTRRGLSQMLLHPEHD